MANHEYFSTTKPTEAGWYWIQNITVMDEPEIVFVRPINLFGDSSELGYITLGGADVKPLNSIAADLFQWQKATWNRPAGVVVWFGTRTFGTGLSLEKIGDEENPLWEYLKREVFDVHSVEMEWFDDCSVASVVLQGAAMSDLIVAVLEQIAGAQNVQCRVRPSEYIGRWRLDKELRKWD